MALDFYRPNVLGFDGVSSYLTIASAALTATPLTLAAWIYIQANAVAGTILQVKNSAGAAFRDCFTLDIANLISGSHSIAARTGAATNNSNATSVFGASEGRWWHVAGTFASATNRQAWISATPGTVQATSRVPSGINSTSIGASLESGGTAAFFDGAIAHAAIWNVALDASAISRLARGTLPTEVARESLISYWPLLSGALPPGHDYKQAFNLTANGGFLVAPGPFARFRPYILPSETVAAGAGNPWHYYAQQRRQAA